MVWNLISPNEILAFWGIPNFGGPILKTTLPLSKDAHHIPGETWHAHDSKVVAIVYPGREET